jgi:long-chain acyl-CoA synthetase
VLVDSFLEQTAARTPEMTALVCGRERLSYAELEMRSNRFAHALLARGVRRGDRVAIYLGNSVEAVVSLFATLKAGAVFMMINPSAKAERLGYLLNDSRASAIILPERKQLEYGDILDRASHLHVVVTTGKKGPGARDQGSEFGVQGAGDRSTVDGVSTSFDELLERHAADASPPPKRHIDLDLAGLLYTSGSTGRPKGVMATHQNIVSAALSIISYLENTADDVILNVLPLSFGYGLYQVLMAAQFGGTVVLEPSFAYPHAVLSRLIEERATGFPLVPTMVAILLQMDLAKYNLSCLRYLTTAGAALPAEHAERLRGLLPRVKIIPMYGQTECARVTYLPPEQLDRRPTSVGRGMPNQETAIIDEEGHRVGPGVVGELVIRGSHVMKGYWDMPEETRKKLRPGPFGDEPVLFTNDLFRADEEGYLYFVGRKDDIIKSRGEKVSPREIEDVLYRHPAVAEAAVVGVPDKLLGEAIKAFVTLKPNADVTERELLRHCVEHIEDFMIPQTIEFRDALPKTDNGKIHKRELQGVVP